MNHRYIKRAYWEFLCSLYLNVNLFISINLSLYIIYLSIYPHFYEICE